MVNLFLLKMTNAKTNMSPITPTARVIPAIKKVFLFDEVVDGGRLLTLGVKSEYELGNQ